MNVLLTGSNGLLGVEVTNLFKNKFNLYCIVRDLENVYQCTDISYIKCDLSTDFDIEKLPKRIDVIVHMAQSPFYKEFPNNIENVFNVNTRSTLKLLDYAVKNHVKHFIYTSTGSVYEPYLSTAEDSKLDPSSYYANSKLASERLIHSYKNYLEISILRLFFLYGKHPIKTQSLINNLVTKVATHQEITIDGDNEGLVFAPTLTNNVASCIEQIVTRGISGVMNIANTESVSLKYVIDNIAENLQIPPNIKYKRERSSSRIIPDLELMKNSLPNLEFTPFAQGIKLLIESK